MLRLPQPRSLRSGLKSHIINGVSNFLNQQLLDVAGDLSVSTNPAALNPPPQTRAYFRGRCIERYGAAIVAANWDSLIFDVGEDVLKRVPMMEPLRGSEERVARLLEGAPTAADLLRALGGGHG